MSKEKDYLKSFNYEQQQAITKDEGNVIISASAGSGKTRTMIERIVRLISEQKATVKEILAVTFTESAASDMKRKLKEKMIERIRDGNEVLSEQLDGVATADISTLHSLCGKLCRTYFYLVGIAPDYKIIDAGEASGLKIECLKKVFRELYEKKDEDFLSLSERFLFKRTNRVLEELILTLYEKTSAEARPDHYEKACEKIYSKEGLESVLAELKAYMLKDLSVAKKLIFDADVAIFNRGLDKHEEYLNTLKSDVLAIEKQPLLELKSFVGYKRDVPRQKLDAELEFVKENEKTARDIIKKAVLEYVAPLRTKEIELEALKPLKKTAMSILALVKALRDEYSKQKLDEGVLDFDDMQRYALQILSNSDVCEEVRSKYKYVFVDEYQDINSLQEELLLKLSKDNLFMVGDPKQSIYGFRGCRPEIFEQKFEKMKNDGECVIRLNKNYRCSKKVIDLTNQVFSFCMTKDYYGACYKDSSMLIEGLSYDGKNQGRAHLHMPSLNKEKEQKEFETPRIYDVAKEALEKREQKVGSVASSIADIIRSELTKKYFDKESGKERQITFGDICVLTRNKENDYVSSLVSGLIQKGLPVTSLVEQNVCDYPEVNLLINLLKLLDGGYQNIPLAIVMKSPIGNFSEEDLASIVICASQEGERVDFYKAYKYCLENLRDELGKRLVEFDEYINSLRFMADFIGAKGALDKVILDKYYLEHLLADFSGSKKVERVRRFISLCVQDGASLTVGEMLDKIQKNHKAFTIFEQSDENAVKVQTIHSSKGLEYPVVIVCGLEKQLSNLDSREKVVLDREWGVGVSAFDDEEKVYFDTVLRRLILKKKKLEQIKEETRILYVAMTRAQYSLHLTFDAREDTRKDEFNGASKFIDYLPKSVVVEEPLKSYEIFDQIKRTKKVIIAGADEQEVKALEKKFNFSYEHINDTKLALKKSVTQIVENEQIKDAKRLQKLERAILEQRDIFTRGEDGELKIIDIKEDELLWTTSLSDRERGIVAHKILQNYDFSSEARLKEQAQEMIKRGVLSQNELCEVDIDKMSLALSSNVFDNAKRADVYKEQCFLANLSASDVLGIDSKENVLVQGVIDLLIVGENNAQIIDYKYSKSPIGALKERYSKQLELYALAVEKILNKKVTLKALVNIYSGESAQI